LYTIRSTFIVNAEYEHQQSTEINTYVTQTPSPLFQQSVWRPFYYVQVYRAQQAFPIKKFIIVRSALLTKIGGTLTVTCYFSLVLF